MSKMEGAGSLFHHPRWCVPVIRRRAFAGVAKLLRFKHGVSQRCISPPQERRRGVCRYQKSHSGVTGFGQPPTAWRPRPSGARLEQKVERDLEHPVL